MSNNIRFYRRLKKISQRELADEMGVSPAYISQVENNKTIPNEEFKEKISLKLKEDKDKIFNSNISRSPYMEVIELLIKNTDYDTLKWAYIDNSDINNYPKELIILSQEYGFDYAEFEDCTDIYVTVSKLSSKYLISIDVAKKLYSLNADKKGLRLIADNNTSVYFEPLNKLVEAIENNISYDEEMIQNIDELKSLLDEE